MRSTTLILILVVVGCGKKQDAPAPSAGSASGSAAIAPPAAIDAAPAEPAKPKTCADGDAAACVTEAKAIAPQGAFRANLPKAEADAKVAATAKLAARACELNSPEGCALLAQWGPFGDSDKHLEHACELGYVPACGSVGRGLVDGGKKEHRGRAAELLEKACEADAIDWIAFTSHHGGFCHFLYELYRDKLKDKAKAAKALERACKQGDKQDCPCKTDADCGAVPDDMSGDFVCSETCSIVGG